MPPVAPVSSDAAPVEVHRAKTATVAVKLCMKYSPPTGPISPAAKKPAAGAPPSSEADRLGVVAGHAEHRRSRGRCTRTRARPPAAARPAPPSARSAPGAGRGRRSSRRARAAARPGRAGPRCRARPRRCPDPRPRAADEEVALHVLGLVVVDDDARSAARRRPGRDRRRRGSSIASCSLESAGLPASSRMMCPRRR